jgi:hypothetical protein
LLCEKVRRFYQPARLFVIRTAINIGNFLNFVRTVLHCYRHNHLTLDRRNMGKYSHPKPSASRIYFWRSFILWHLVTWATMFVFPIGAPAQATVNYRLFSKDALGGIHVNVPSPYQFAPVNAPSLSGGTQGVLPNTNASSGMGQQIVGVGPNPNVGMTSNNAQVMQEQADLERESWLNDLNKKALEKEEAIRPYREAFVRLSKMNPDNFSLSSAVYEVENAYLGDELSKEGFSHVLQFRADQVRQMLKAQGLSSKNNLSINYAIQQLFEHPNTYYDGKTQLTHTVPPFKYDFEDYMGEKDYTKLFASKLLATGSGQCHSLPLIYLMIAEQLGAKAWLSLAPEHSFVQFMDSHGRLLDYETTNGNIVSGTWMAGSGYINAKALRNKTYLDTLSQRQLYARCLSDLLLGYLQKFEYDDFAQEIRNGILRIDPSNITGLIVDANLKRTIAWRAIKAAGMPKPADLPKYPQAFQCYQEMKEAISKIDDLGYQDMPPNAYQAWLKSIEVEKKRLATEKLQERIRLEAKMQKSSLQNKKK